MMPQTEAYQHTDHIDYGETARLGIIIPSGNVVAEREIAAMLPNGISAHFTRLRLRGSSVEELQSMTSGLEEAAGLLADAKVDKIIFHCTAVTTFDAEAGLRISQRISNATGTQSFSTSEAIVAAFRAFDAHRAVLISPYVEDIHERERQFLRAHGIEVVSDGRMDVGPVEMLGRIPPKAFVDLAQEKACAEAQMFFLSCTATRTAGVIRPLELLLGRPVTTSNQAMVWYALRTCHVVPSATGYGELFTRHLSADGLGS
jgi:maleate isomerase